MDFFKSFLASVLGTIVAWIFLGVLFTVAIAGIASIAVSEEQVSVEVRENSVLKIDLDLPLVENVPATQELEKALGLSPDILPFSSLIGTIRKASTDDNIRGIDLKVQFPSMGWSQAKAIRKAIQDFKDQGKFVYTFGDYYSQKGYYIASVSDSIFINPVGGMELKGLAAEVLYYKDFQEKYGFKMEVVRHGKYKSAVEPYLEREMSENNRIQISSLLNSVWSTISKEMISSRGMTQAQMNDIAENLGASLPEKALKNGLVDGTAYADEYQNKLKSAVGLDADSKLRILEINDWIKPNSLNKKGIRDNIAVIYAQGPILYGEGNESVIGQDVFVEAIEEAVKNRRVKAIVLRINSPGGSALSSEIIWKALMDAKAKKPLVVSMGNVAASGGYYLATAGDEIYANDLTITGSIGVFATLPNMEEFSESIGINAEYVKTHENSVGFSLFQKPSESFRKNIKEGIESVYETFKQRVAESRNMTLEQVEEIAQGRVWTGTQALENGLIDGLGGFDQAISAAARLAELDEYNLTSYPNIEPEIDDFLSMMGPFGSVETALLKQFPSEIKTFISTLSDQKKGADIQVRLPFSLEIN